MNEGDPLVCTGDKLAAYLHGSLSISLFSKALEEDGGVLDEESVPPGSAYNQPQPHCLKVLCVCVCIRALCGVNCSFVSQCMQNLVIILHACRAFGKAWPIIASSCVVNVDID